ncbi:MAG: DUF2341 domain-containing protein, partial [Fibrobacteria bacterium]|nr:DUF2341 domain-containing protein [Fibrobacteria bacterium]
PEARLENSGFIRVSLHNTKTSEGDYIYISGTSVLAIVKTKHIVDEVLTVSDVPMGTYKELLYSNDFDSVYNLIQDTLAVSSDSVSVIGPYRDWNGLSKVAINTSSSGAAISEDLYDFPLLVRLHKNNFSFAEALDDGQDIRFSTPGGTILPYEISRWDKAGLSAEIWVRIDTIFGNNETQYFNMHWGSTLAADISNSKAVFDSANGYVSVWHLEENGSGQNDEYIDGSANGDHGTGISMGNAVSSVVGNGQEFDGTDSYIELDDSTGLDGAGAFTISFWCNADSINFPFMNGLFTRGSDEKVGAPYIEGLMGENTLRMYFSTEGHTGDCKLVSPALTQGKWHYVTFTWDGIVATAYMDGTVGAADSTSGNMLLDSDGSNWIGNMPGWGKWDGKLDELRVLKAHHSADWIKMNYETQKVGSKVVKIK